MRKEHDFTDSVRHPGARHFRLQVTIRWANIGLAALLVPRLLSAEPPPPDLVSPSQISSQYLRGDAKDIQKAKMLLLEWLSTKRQSEEYGDHHDNNYACAVRIIQAADGETAVDAFLEQELSLTKSRRSRYAILQQMAERKERQRAYADAIALWRRARESVMDGTHPYYTTRQALPLMKIGRLFLASGKKDAAKESFEQYVSSEYGSKEANGVFVVLGDLYEESGEWEKARALYGHYHQINYYRNDAELRRRLSVPENGTLLKAQDLLVGLRDGARPRRRAARNALYELILSSGRTETWVRWLTQTLSVEKSEGARAELEILRPLLTPLAQIGDQSIRGDAAERLQQMEKDRQQYRAYEELLQALFSRNAGNKYAGAGGLGLDGPYTLAGLSSTTEFRDAMENLYAQMRARLLNPHQELPDHERTPHPNAPATSTGLREILRENRSFRDCLKQCISRQAPQSGPAFLYLYALGFKEDIDFIIDHIPDDAYTRNHCLVWLATALYRDRTVDIPRVMGRDRVHVRDWWNVEPDGKPVRQAFKDWWGTRKSSFEYGGRESAGQRIYGVDFISRMTAFAPAPELDGVFFFVEGGFLDYSGSVYFFNFRTAECRPLIGHGFDGGQGVQASANSKWKQSGLRIGSLSGLCWNPQTMSCEFNISGDKRIGVVFSRDGSTVESIQEIPAPAESHPKVQSLGPGIQRRGNFTFEIRRGDLYVVNEANGQEACLETFGYILSFTLNQKGTKVITIDREILNPSLNLYDIETKLAALQSH